ncbi:MAG: hypothetical protein ACLQME_04150 [Alphaproteobacteria bacterium]
MRFLEHPPAVIDCRIGELRLGADGSVDLRPHRLAIPNDFFQRALQRRFNRHPHRESIGPDLQKESMLLIKSPIKSPAALIGDFINSICHERTFSNDCDSHPARAKSSLTIGEGIMTVTSVTRFSGGNRDSFLATAKKAKEIFERAGDDFRLGQIYSSPHIGNWVALLSFQDWGAYGAAMKSLSSDPEYQKMMAEVGSISQAVDRTFIIGVDV